MHGRGERQGWSGRWADHAAWAFARGESNALSCAGSRANGRAPRESGRGRSRGDKMVQKARFLSFSIVKHMGSHENMPTHCVTVYYTTRVKGINSEGSSGGLEEGGGRTFWSHESRATF